MDYRSPWMDDEFEPFRDAARRIYGGASEVMREISERTS